MQDVVQSSETAVDLQAQLSCAQQKIEHQKSYIEQLEEFIRNLRHKQFGASSEARDTLQSSLFDEDECADPADEPADTLAVAAHTRRPRAPERIPANLPRE